jgi:predicted dienelactone hydrolase
MIYSNLINKRIVWLKLACQVCIIGLLPTLTAYPVLGAEKLTLSYGVIERSIPIKSLEKYAKTGTIDDDLAGYAKYANQTQLAQLRKVLLTRIPINLINVSQFFYSQIGEKLLEKLGELIQTESHLSGFYAIRASLILAAAEPDNFTLLNVLSKFPTNSISIDLEKTLSIAETLQNLVNQTQNSVAFINQQSQIESNTSNVTSELLAKIKTPTKLNWKKQTITLNDQSRNRTFPADIYLPDISNPRPIIVISHGLGSDRSSFAYLAENLAQSGFVVAVPEHPGSNAEQLKALLAGTAQTVTSPKELIDRPLDVKYLLDELTRLSQNNSEFKGHLNLEKIGVVGQSYGGYTALALAGAKINFEQLKKDCPDIKNTFNISLLLQCLAINLPNQEYNLFDPRVKAIIAINPVDSSIMGKSSISQIKIPVMIISGSTDTIAPALPEQILPFTWLTTPNKYLVLINGGTHFSTIAESPNAVVPVPIEVIGSSPSLARSYVKALSLPFLQTYVAEQQSYLPYLNADYANMISRQPLPLSLVKSLTLEQLQEAFK